MKLNGYFLGLIIFATLTFSGCERFDKGLYALEDDTDGSDAPAWAGGSKDENDQRKQNDSTGVPRGDDYGDLYVLKRLVNGVPEMGITSLGIWYPKVVAFDVNGDPVVSNGEFVTLSVDDEGELNDKNYSPKEVDFGRMNLVRAPEGVLSAALKEAISSLTTDVEYVTTDFCGRLVAVHGEQLDWLPGSTEEDDKTIDSPRENMAIYRELMRFGFSNQLAFLNQEHGFLGKEDVLKLAAAALAAGSDKTGQIILDEVVYINGFLDAYDLDDCIALSDIPFYNDYSYEWDYCDDDYYSKLHFYNYSYSVDNDYNYDREYLHGGKWVKIITLNSDDTYTEEVKRLLDVVPFNNVRIDIAHNQNENVAGFTQACDDAVQILEFIHESALVEYLGEHEFEPSL